MEGLVAKLFQKAADDDAKTKTKATTKKKTMVGEFARGLVAGLAVQATALLLNKIQEIVESRKLRRRQEEEKRETVILEVHLKQGFAPWKKLFDEDARNREGMCDESLTTCAKVSDSLAVVTLHSVDMAAFAAFTQDETFAKMVEPYVERHVPYVGTKIP